ncbi:hypothetical protein [Carboxylicivirga sp. N1Y90]|uniref:hypothetical protein n=1 Tax=Carboxylicivirga fragile TaxID=3417571 RepID=UPI003D358E06|nr:hypothetical protein [Marinilabiliaceae bacterium N1Y90]
MKKKIYSVVLLILMFGNVQAQENETIHIYGKVEVSNTEEEVPFAFIANSATGIGKETNDKGLFKIQVCLSDTILFRCMGYEDGVWPVAELDLDQTIIILEVQPKQYALEAVDVLWFRSYATFRHKIANMDMMPTKMHMPIHIDMKELNAIAKAESGMFGGGISMGTYRTKEEKQYAKLLAYESLYSNFNRLASRENLQVFTKFQGGKLDSFIVFLRSKHNIDPKLPDYEMMEAINLVYEEFLALQTDTIAN